MKRVVVVAAIGLMAGMGQEAEAANVSVTCEDPEVVVKLKTNGDDFDLFASGYPDNLATNVTVTPHSGWKLEAPDPATFPMSGTGTKEKKYAVTRPPEQDSGGTIYFHNYYIKSNSSENKNSKNIIVPVGETVTYTAHKNGNSCTSNWTVTGPGNFKKEDNGKSSIMFNRSWWQVGSWGIPSSGTPLAGVYNIKAVASSFSDLTDSGQMTMVGVKRIDGGGKFSEKESEGELTNAETVWTETKNGSLALTATPEPNVAWPSGTPTWDASCGFWCVLGNHFVGNTTGTPNVTVKTSSPDVIVVTAKCGDSQKCIKVIAYELSFDISKNNLTLKHERITRFTVIAEPSSVIPTPTVEIKRTGIGPTDWMDLLSRRGSFDWTARVAGQFELRVRAEIDGTNKFTNVKDMTVQFPVYAQIEGDSTVRRGTRREWQQTLRDCTGPEDLTKHPPVKNERRERGFWIFLNTSGSGTYSCGSSIEGPLVGPDVGAYIVLGDRLPPKLSDVAPNASGATYAVAAFHTHTPSSYRFYPPPPAPHWDRPTGPSQPPQSDNDIDFHIYQNVAGIVYDYTASHALMGHSKDDPAQRYSAGNQRDIGRE